MRSRLTALLCCAMALSATRAADAKAHLILVYPAQSEAAFMHDEGVLAKDVTARIAALPGYESQLILNSAPAASASKLGAEGYLVVEAVRYDDGTKILVVESFLTRAIEPVAINRIRVDNWALASDFDVATVLNGIGPPVPSAQMGSSAASGPASGAHDMVALPGGTQVAIHLVDKLSSANATANQTFAFQAWQDVIINGWVVIKKDAPGQGTIVSAEGAGGNGGGGKLVMRFDYITAADGMKVQLSDTNSTQAGDDKKGASSTATIIGYAFLGLPGLFMHNFVHGKQTEIDPSTKLTIFVDHTVGIAAVQPAAAPAGYAK